MNPAAQIKFTLIGEYLKFHGKFPDIRELDKIVEYILAAPKMPSIIPATFAEATVGNG